MEFTQYKNSFTKEAQNLGYTEQTIKHCLNYAAVLFSNHVPIIYNTSHLSGLVGYKKEYLKKAILYPNSFYRDFQILKKKRKETPNFRTASEFERNTTLDTQKHTL